MKIHICILIISIVVMTSCSDGSSPDSSSSNNKKSEKSIHSDIKKSGENVDSALNFAKEKNEKDLPPLHTEPPHERRSGG